MPCQAMQGFNNEKCCITAINENKERFPDIYWTVPCCFILNLCFRGHAISTKCLEVINMKHSGETTGKVNQGASKASQFIKSEQAKKLKKAPPKGV